MKIAKSNKFMSEYIDAEKLRKSLANRYEEITVPILTDEGGLESFYRRSEIHNTLKIVDSLQQEQEEVDLEKALNELDNAYFDLDGIAVMGATYYLTVNDLKDIACHFYELGFNARKEESK